MYLIGELNFGDGTFGRLMKASTTYTASTTPTTLPSVQTLVSSSLPIESLSNCLNALLYVYRGSTIANKDEMVDAVRSISDWEEDRLKILSESIDEFQKNVKEANEKRNMNTNATNFLNLSWKLGVTVSSSEDPEGENLQPFVYLNFEVEEAKKQSNVCCDMTFDEFKSLHKELKGIRKKMMTA